jgi:unsaturated rhamnogalacturonyl hydrolase
VYLPLILLARHSPRRREIEDLAAECAETLCRNLRDERTGLYWHGLPARRAGHEAFMGHGTGWSAFGLAQILDALGPEHPRRPALLRHFQQLCGAAAACQDANGGFHSLLNVPWTLFNVHYTGWLGYAFLHGARCGHLDVEFRERGRRAWHALKRRTFRGGIITSCGGSPVARCLDFYVERFGELRMDHFAAPSPRQALYTLNEILRLAS